MIEFSFSKPLLFLIFFLSSCASISGLFQNSPSTGEHKLEAPVEQKIETKSETVGMKSETIVERKTSQKDIDTENLKYAKVSKRLDELERLTLKMKEKILLLEDAITLGIKPKGLDRSEEKRPVIEIEPKTKPTETPEKHSAIELESKEKFAKTDKQFFFEENISKTTKEDVLLKGKDFYNQENYKIALEIFQTLEADTTITVPEEISYWIGLCYWKLENFDSGRISFEKFLAKNTKNPLTPSSKYYLALCEIKMNLKEHGIKRLKEILDEYPLDAFAQNAKDALSSMSKTL